MTKINTFVTRGNNIESKHSIKALVINENGKILLSTKNNFDYIYPRSSIKIFQAIPFVLSGAISKFKLNSKQIALSCSSHCGEKNQIKELQNWLKKINISVNELKCGVHNPLNLKSSNKLLLSGLKPNQLHNNCSGKHMAMIASCLSNHKVVKNYLDFNHYHQINIRKIFEIFTNKKIRKNNFSLDGCSAPQYAFQIDDLSRALVNLVKSYNSNFHYSTEVKILINNIIENPNMIGGVNKFDSYLIKHSKKNIFCKGGAEGVFLFIHLKKGIFGILKVIDGNERVLPSAVYALFKKLKIIDKVELKKLKDWSSLELQNHAKIKIGAIKTVIK